MKKGIVLLAILVIAAGLLISFRFIVMEPSSSEELFSGKALMEMEHETTKRVETMREEIRTGRIQKSDFSVEIKGLMEDIFYSIFEQENQEENYSNAIYSSNIIRQLGWILEDRQDMTAEELALQEDTLTVFSNEVFNYYLEVGRNSDEEAERMRLTEQAKKIERNLDKRISEYTESIYNWYLSDKGKSWK